MSDMHKSLLAIAFGPFICAIALSVIFQIDRECTNRGGTIIRGPVGFKCIDESALR